MKKAQVTIWIIVAIFLVGAIIVAVMMWSTWEVEPEIRECSLNDDCWFATLYDPNDCVPGAFVDYRDLDGVRYKYKSYGENVVYYRNCSVTETSSFDYNVGGETISIPYLIYKECDIINNCVEICDPLACIQNLNTDDFADCECINDPDPSECDCLINNPSVVNCINYCENNNARVQSLKDCSLWKYEPNCTLSVNLHCPNKGRCECEDDLPDRYICVVKM